VEETQLYGRFKTGKPSGLYTGPVWKDDDDCTIVRASPTMPCLCSDTSTTAQARQRACLRLIVGHKKKRIATTRQKTTRRREIFCLRGETVHLTTYAVFGSLAKSVPETRIVRLVPGWLPRNRRTGCLASRMHN
jgi:hypothetical protein